ncbi:hypothetical protein [Actinokineospora sp.]|uniref:hypothetical protein n=1 Tax=Actinokineospora sp. TaxID=1872133 RepID=UPI003D6B3C8C
MTDTPRPTPDDRAAGKAADAAGTPPDASTQPTAALPDPNQPAAAPGPTAQPEPGQPTTALPDPGAPAVPVVAQPVAPAKPKRTVSLLVAGLVGAGLLVAGGVGGYFIGEAGDDRRGGPGFAREDRMGPGPGRGPHHHGPWRDMGERRGGMRGPGDVRPPGDLRPPGDPATPPTVPTPASPAPTTTPS